MNSLPLLIQKFLQIFNGTKSQKSCQSTFMNLSLNNLMKITQLKIMLFGDM